MLIRPLELSVTVDKTPLQADLPNPRNALAYAILYAGFAELVISFPTNIRAPTIARAKGLGSLKGSPLRKSQLPKRPPQAPDRLTVALLKDLLGLELGLQLLHPRAVLPLAPARAAVQLDASGKLLAALSAGWQQMEQVTPQMGEAQGALQLPLLNAGQALQLSQLIKQSADGVEPLTAANSRWVLR